MSSVENIEIKWAQEALHSLSGKTPVRGVAKIFPTHAPKTGILRIAGLGIVEGVYSLTVLNDSLNEVLRYVKMVRKGQETLKFTRKDERKLVRAGRKYFLILSEAFPEDFIATHPSKLVSAVNGKVSLVADNGENVEVEAELREFTGRTYLELRLRDADGGFHEFHVTSSGRLYFFADKAKLDVTRLEIKTVKDYFGRDLARLMLIHYKPSYKTLLVIERSTSLEETFFLSNEENFIDFKPSWKSVSLNEALRTVLGEEGFSRLLSELGNGEAVVGVTYSVNGKICASWSRSNLKFEVYGADRIIGVLVVRRNGLNAVSYDEKVSAKLVGDRLRIKGVEGLDWIRVREARFRNVAAHNPTLEITLESGSRICFKIAPGWDGRTVKAELAYPKGRATPRMTILEYIPQKTISLREKRKIKLKELLVIEYNEAGKAHRTIIGSNKPEEIMQAKHLYSKICAKRFFEKQGWRIVEEEHNECTEHGVTIWPDYWIRRITRGVEENAFVECKHGAETDLPIKLIKQARIYYNRAKSKGYLLFYYFSGEPQFLQAMQLYQYLLELKNRDMEGVKIYISDREVA